MPYNGRWQPKRNIEFIHEYKLQECLWNPTHALYKNREAREAAYKKIMARFCMESVKEVVTKIRALRNTYHNEALKAKKLRIIGTSYQSKIPWLPHLKFIKYTDSGKIKGNEIVTHSHTSSIEFVDSPENDVQEPEDPPIPPPKKRNTVNDPLPRPVGTLANVSQHFPSNRAGNDEFDLFGQTVAQQLRQLPLATALETEEMVLAVIRKQRVKIHAPEENPLDGSESVIKVDEHWWETPSESMDGV